MPIESTELQKELNKCILNEAVVNIIKSQYRNRTKLDVSNFLRELLYQDKRVQELTIEYRGSLNDKTFLKLIDYLGLSK